MHQLRTHALAITATTNTTLLCVCRKHARRGLARSRFLRPPFKPRHANLRLQRHPLLTPHHATLRTSPHNDAMHAGWCTAFEDHGPGRSPCPENGTMVALRDRGSNITHQWNTMDWRCYWEGTLSSDHTHYENGTCYCTVEQYLSWLNCSCNGGGGE
jgi:hypothetical protein